jgi:3'(2'),5'-bisphosphate nucleotidase
MLDKQYTFLYDAHMEQLLTIAITAAKEAGEAIMELYETTTFETKKDGSPVTIADHKANEIILRHLATTGILVLSEESDGVPTPYPSRMWIIDPIDGTNGFIKSTGDFAVMIGLIEDGAPVLGVVYAPAHKKLFYAHKGSGAHLETQGTTTALRLNDTPHTPLRFICSSNHFSPMMEEVCATLNATKVPIGGIGIKTSIIAENAGDFFFTGANLGEWDVCAPHIILEEAGGVVTDCLGNPLVYGTKNHLLERGALFAHKESHKAVLEAIHALLPTV